MKVVVEVLKSSQTPFSKRQDTFFWWLPCVSWKKDVTDVAPSNGSVYTLVNNPGDTTLKIDDNYNGAKIWLWIHFVVKFPQKCTNYDIQNNTWVTVYNDFCGHEWCDLPMIFASDEVMNENHWQIASRVTKKRYLRHRMYYLISYTIPLK